MNDLCAVVLMGGLGIFLCISDKIVQGNMLTVPTGGILVRADMYIRLIGGILILLSVLLFIKNLNFNRSVKTTGLIFPLTSQAVLTFISLIIYTLLLHTIGFALDTFLLSFFLVFLYMRKENPNIAFASPILVRMAVISTIFSLILVGVVYVIFGKILFVALP